MDIGLPPHPSTMRVLFPKPQRFLRIMLTDSDDNGTLQSAASTFPNAVVSSVIVLGPSGNTEPTGEHLTNAGHTADVDVLETGTEDQGTQPDGRANMTVDFGFYRVGVGDIVWMDTVNTNGLYASGETLVNGAVCRLYAANGTTEIPVGRTAILGRLLLVQA